MDRKQLVSHPMPSYTLCDKISIVNLDGDDLCLEHANAWARAEGIAAAEMEQLVNKEHENE